MVLSLKKKVIIGLIIVVFILFIYTLYLLYNYWSSSNGNEKFGNVNVNGNNGNSKEGFSNRKKAKFTNTLPTSIKYVSDVYSIAIYNNTTPFDSLQLAGIFIYDEKGNSINLLDSKNGFTTTSSPPNPFSSSNKYDTLPSRILNIQNSQPTRTLSNAISMHNTSENNYAGLPNNTFTSWPNGYLTNFLHTNEGQFGYWIYNFNNPLNISAVEVFSRTDVAISRQHNMIINLYNDSPSNPIQRYITTNPDKTLIATATYGPNIDPWNSVSNVNNSHKVFVIDSSLVPSSNAFIPATGYNNTNIINAFTGLASSLDTYNFPLKYVSGVQSIAIYNDNNAAITLAGLFIYDKNGNAINLIDPVNNSDKKLQDPSTGYYNSNPYQYIQNGDLSANRCLNTYYYQSNRNIYNAISSFNNYSSNFCGLNTSFMTFTNDKYINNYSETNSDGTKKPNYWIYNFNTPVNISAVEIFSDSRANSFKDKGVRLNNLQFVLLNTPIIFTSKTGGIVLSPVNQTNFTGNTGGIVLSPVNQTNFTGNTDLNIMPTSKNTLAYGTFGQVKNTSASAGYEDLTHKVFVIDPSLIPSTNPTIATGSDNTNIINTMQLGSASSTSTSSIISQIPKYLPLQTPLFSIQYVPGVSCIAIYLPGYNVLSLSGVFIYDQNGKAINLLDPENGYRIGTGSSPNPQQSSMEDQYPDNAIKSLMLQPNRNISNAIYPYNNYSNSFIGLNNFFYKWNYGYTTGTQFNNPSFWLYNFTKPVNISAFEIFTRQDCCPDRTNNLTINLYNKIIQGSNFTNMGSIQTYIQKGTNSDLIASGTFGKVTGNLTDQAHKVFVVDPSLVPSTNDTIASGSENTNIINPMTISSGITINTTPPNTVIQYIAGVKSIVISNTIDLIVLSGIFIYDDKGNLIQNIAGGSTQSTNWRENTPPDMLLKI